MQTFVSIYETSLFRVKTSALSALLTWVLVQSRTTYAQKSLYSLYKGNNPWTNGPAFLTFPFFDTSVRSGSSTKRSSSNTRVADKDTHTQRSNSYNSRDLSIVSDASPSSFFVALPIAVRTRAYDGLDQLSHPSLRPHARKRRPHCQKPLLICLHAPWTLVLTISPFDQNAGPPLPRRLHVTALPSLRGRSALWLAASPWPTHFPLPPT